MTENNIQINNSSKKNILKQLALTEDMNQTLEQVRDKYARRLNIEMTLQDVVRKMIQDHPDYQKAEKAKYQ